MSGFSCFAFGETCPPILMWEKLGWMQARTIKGNLIHFKHLLLWNLHLITLLFFKGASLCVCVGKLNSNSGEFGTQCGPLRSQAAPMFRGLQSRATPWHTWHAFLDFSPSFSAQLIASITRNCREEELSQLWLKCPSRLCTHSGNKEVLVNVS